MKQEIEIGLVLSRCEKRRANAVAKVLEVFEDEYYYEIVMEKIDGINLY